MTERHPFLTGTLLERFDNIGLNFNFVMATPEFAHDLHRSEGVRIMSRIVSTSEIGRIIVAGEFFRDRINQVLFAHCNTSARPGSFLGLRLARRPQGLSG